MKLYELPSMYRQIDDLLDESGGEITEEIASRLADADATLESKVDAVCAIVRERLAAAAADATEAAFFAKRARVHENSAERLRTYLQDCLAACGLDRAAGQRFSARLQQNGTPSIVWAGEGPPPEAFTKTTTVLDGLAAQRAYREGTLPEGFAVEHGQHLRIR